MASIPVGRPADANHVRKNGGVGCDSKLTGHPTPSYITRGVTFVDPAQQERVKRGLLTETRKNLLKHARTPTFTGHKTQQERVKRGLFTETRKNLLKHATTPTFTGHKR